MEYPHLTWLARDYGVGTETLVEIFSIEKEFHARILATDCAADRKRQYDELYNKVHSLKAAGAIGAPGEGTAKMYARLARTFRREMEGKSVLDVGCGNGEFLAQLARLLPHGRLCGIDTSDVHLPSDSADVGFLRKDIIDFELEDRFDVVFSHQVWEHIAPADLPGHLKSVRAALKPAGTFIVILPNRYWGPQDITRIVDNTFTGRVGAMGSHLNESSYSELVPQLTAHGFQNFRTLLPFAVHLPALAGVRVRPVLNRVLETNSGLRHFVNRLRMGGRPVFRNPIALICDLS
jgi:SAM-dependent methyltransferase